MEAEQVRYEKEIAEKDAEIARLKAEGNKKDERIAELEQLLVQQSTNQPQVIMNNFFLLSVPKTNKYVRGLNNDGRQFVGHMFHQTMPDDTPKSVLMQVDEMTSLDRTDLRLAESMEKLASKPTTQNVYGDKNDFQDGAQMLKMAIPEGADPAEIAARIAEQQRALLEQKEQKK
jgi:hypothetical protein